MQITVKLQASLRKFAPAGGGAEFALQVAEGVTVQDVFDRLGIDGRYRPVIFINGEPETSREAVLHDGDYLHLMPAMAGG